MNKKLLIVAVSLLVLAAANVPVSALEVIIDSKGTMTFYNDGVLGDTTEDEDEQEDEAEDEDENQQEDEDNDEQEEIKEKNEEMKQRHQEELREQNKQGIEVIKKRQEVEREQLKKKSELLRKKQIETSAKNKQERPLKVVTSAQEKELRIKRENEKTKLEVREKSSDGSTEVEELNPERLRIELMATPREDLTEEQLDEIGNRNAQVRLEERKERIGEFLELKRAQNDENSPLELHSRDVVAEINESVVLSIDPETNEMSVVSPTGEVVKVVHLPDQAIARLEELGTLENVEEDDKKRIEMVTNEDGSIVYQLTVPRKKKLLGIFDREVETEVELNDETGLSTETEVKHGGFRGFLDSLTF